MKVLVTGGHITPALAVIDELISREHSVAFVGRQHVNPKESRNSFEYDEITTRKIVFYDLPTGRFQRFLNFEIFNQLYLFVRGLIMAYQILSKEKPNIVMSFGGYIALPIALAACVKGIKIVTHEQTLVPGATNRLIARYAQSVCVSFPESAAAFGSKAVVTGNPIRKQLLNSHGNDMLRNFARPILYISGGSLGSHALNMLIEKNIEGLLEKFDIIHQTGNVQEFGDYERLSKRQNDHYIVKSHISTQDLAEVFKKADVVISRSGANTFFEIVALRKPAILVPLPWSAGGEQLKQAQLLASKHGAEIFEQGSDDENFVPLVLQVYNHRKEYVQQLEHLHEYVKSDAPYRIVEVLKKVSA